MMQDKQNEGIIELDSKDDVKRKYRNFKNFEIVEDYSDHHYLKSKSSQCHQETGLKRFNKNGGFLLETCPAWFAFAKVPNDPPVCLYEGRMDILRAVIIGVEGTPYCDGLFFFDVCFPQNYPNDPPHFEDLVIGHFCDRANGILTTCKAYYTNGIAVKYGIDVGKETSCSLKLKKDVEEYMKTLIGAFKKIGVEDLEDFVPPIEDLTQKNTVQLQKKKNKLIHKILACLGI
ncbi:hypothetical protein L1987_74065 [Smallanthus sonchifolius]|uniref:Uncharacterized protein n=1 Tax=Smallanthus sonchifolius TaxID=185202 RepID=A0ACB9A2K4_9ASTR|nr:hypothetical protein L1987_74065 [Smallanthus sonchifolius]